MVNNIPVAKRTRSGVDRILYQRWQRGKRVKSSGAGAPVPEYGGASEVEYVNVDWEDDGEEFSEVKKVESSKSRKCEGKGKNDKKMEKIWHASDDNDVVVMLDSSSDSDDVGAEDEILGEEEVDSDVMVVSVIDKKVESEDERVVVDDVKEDVADLSDSTSSEGENFYGEESDETYNEDMTSDDVVDEGLDESSSSSSSSEDESEDVSLDNDEVKWGFSEKSDVRGKGKGRRADHGGEKRIKIGNKSCYYVDDDDFDEGNWIRKHRRSVGRKNEERSGKSGVKKRTKLRDFEVKSRIWGRNDVKCKGKGRIDEVKRTELRDFEVMSRIWERNDVKCKGKGRIDDEAGKRGTRIVNRMNEHVEYRVNGRPDPRGEEVVEMLSSDDEIRGNFVERDGLERRKQMAKKRRASDNLDRLQILADSLHGKGEVWKKFEEEKPKYKFWFKDEDEKPVEKSEFDKHLDDLFKEMNMCLAFDQIGSTPLVRIHLSNTQFTVKEINIY